MKKTDNLYERVSKDIRDLFEHIKVQDGIDRNPLQVDTVEIQNVCGTKICFGDDFGDNETTFTCYLPKGHKGLHTEMEILYGKKYVLFFEGDDNKYEI